MEDAERDRAKRWEVVQRKKFECFGVGGKGEGFVFSVKGREGVEIEDDGEK